jgi:peptidylprolyl isomerase
MVRTRLVLVAAVLMAISACSSGDDGASRSSDTTTAPTAAAQAAPTDTEARPTVTIPASLPTDLVITEIVPGRGREAQTGDAVVVDYVGARTVNGEEFDNSWDRGQPLVVVLGTQSVIAGWEQGLLGSRGGSRLQLDIPASLAYGDTSPSPPIQPGDALSFVVDIRAVVPMANPEDAPDVDIPTSLGASSVTVEDLVVGDGRLAIDGSQALVQLMVYRGDTGELLDSTWSGSGPVRLVVARAQLVEGMYQAMSGMRQGGRRLVIMPFADAFGEEGNAELGLPPRTDVVLVIDALAVF